MRDFCPFCSGLFCSVALTVGAVRAQLPPPTLRPTVAPEQVGGATFQFAQNPVPNGLLHPGFSPMLNPPNFAWGFDGSGQPANQNPTRWSEGELVCVNQVNYLGDLGGVHDLPNQSLIELYVAGSLGIRKWVFQ